MALDGVQLESGLCCGKIEIRQDGPIVQRIGHTPSKGTMLVRFQLGLPGNGHFSLKEKFPTSKELIAKKKLRTCRNFFLVDEVYVAECFLSTI